MPIRRRSSIAPILATFLVWLTLLPVPVTSRFWAAAYEISPAPISVTFLEAGEVETITNVDAGTGADRCLLVYVAWRDRSNVISGIDYGATPEAMASADAKLTQNGVLSGQLWYLAGPASGANDLVITMGAGAGGPSTAQVGVWVANGCDQVTPVDGFQDDLGGGSSANIVSAPGAVTSAAGDLVATFHATRNVTGNIAVTTSTGYTEREDAADGGGFSMQFGDAAGAASVTTSATWDNGAFAVDWVAHAINVNASGGAAPAPKCFGLLTGIGCDAPRP